MLYYTLVKQTLRSWLEAHESKGPESWKHKHLGDKQFREFVAPVIQDRLKRLERRYLTSPTAVELRKQPCAYCGGPGGTVDHILPVALGGTDDADNLAPACQPCNSRKGIKLLSRVAGPTDVKRPLMGMGMRRIKTPPMHNLRRATDVLGELQHNP